MVSENPTTAIPTAGNSNAAISPEETRGICSAGKSAGIVPATSIPYRVKSKTATTAVAAKTASNGPGTRGVRHASTTSVASTAAASNTVGQCQSPRCAASDRICAATSLPDIGTPVTAPSWLTIMVPAIPAKYPTSTGLDNISASTPSLASAAARHTPPTSTASTAARAA